MYIVLDASPLIYLAKLDALDAIAIAGHTAVVAPSVDAEAARPELAFRHPEIAIIQRTRAAGQLLVVELDERERELAIELAGRYGGLHAGELDVLALGQIRGWAVCFHERQAARIAGALGVATIDLVEILFGGTPDVDLLARRVRAFARLTNLTMTDLDALLELIGERR
jgi:hypothetical protein